MKAGEWTIRSRRVVTPSGIRAADVVIRDETIAALLEYDGPEAEGVILDVGDLAVLPGLVALHRGEDDPTALRSLEALTRDCAAGGVTTLVGLPSRIGPGPNGASDDFRRLASAPGRLRVDCGLVVPLGRGNADRIESWIEAGFLGVEAFLGDGGPGTAPASSQADLRQAMPLLARLGRPLLVDLSAVAPSGGPADEADRFDVRLPERESAAIRLLIGLCRETRCRLHLIQPSAGEALPMIAEARAEGLPLTAETCPRHLGLTLTEVVEGVPTFPTLPGRHGSEARERLWDGLQSRLIDAIGPDHPRPELPTHRGKGTNASSSLRRMLPAVWAEARRRGLTLDLLGPWLAGRPARLLGLADRKGAIAEGGDADLVVFDPEASPWDGPEGPGMAKPLELAGSPLLAGRVEATILRGTLIYHSGQSFEDPKGAVLLRLEMTQPIPGTDD